MKAEKRADFNTFPKDYASLCQRLAPRPIRDSVDYENVVEIIDAMVLWHDRFTRDQHDYFDILCSMVEEYEKERFPEPALGGREALAHLLHEHGMNGAALSRVLGASRNVGAMIIRGERNLTVDHIRKLAKHFSVSSELFIRESQKKKAGLG